MIYTGALCGLGYDRKLQKPIFTDHDIEHKFDFKTNNHDIKQVSKIIP